MGTLSPTRRSLGTFALVLLLSASIGCGGGGAEAPPDYPPGSGNIGSDASPPEPRTQPQPKAPATSTIPAAAAGPSSDKAVSPAVKLGKPSADVMKQLKKQIERTDSEYAGAQDRLQPVESSGLAGGCRGQRAYDADEVRATLDAARESLQKATAPEELAALRAYVDRKLPRMPGPKSSECFRGRQIVNLDEANSAIFALSVLIDKLKKKSSLSVRFQIQSQPTSARLYLAIAGSGTRVLDAFTNTSNVNMYRGLYTLVLTKPGYKDVRQELNLVDNDPSTINCELKNVGDLDESFCK